ncbi:MAG: exonuclease domain-containing protein [Erythrobacter sp.]
MFARWRFERSLRSLQESEHAIFRDYAIADWPARDRRAMEASYLALDFELDGLRKDAHLLQAGWVPATTRSVSLEQAHSADIRSSATLDDTAVTIHGIGEQRALQGEPLRDVMEAIIGSLAGRILVGHAAGIEVQAIQQATRKLWGLELPVRSVCTLALERHLKPALVGPEVYRLGPTRARYGLPDYGAHDALTDAIAAAELFQAQMTRLPEDCPLSRVEDA